MTAESCFEIETFKVRLKASLPEKLDRLDTFAAINILTAIYKDLDADREHFTVLFLDQKLGLRGYKTLFSGTQTAVHSDPASIFRAALLFGAARIVTAHNHPSGDSRPSPQDADMHQSLCDLGRRLGVEVVDNIILGNGTWYWYSFALEWEADQRLAARLVAERAAQPPALRPDGKKRRSDFGRARARYKDRTAPRKDAGIPRGPRKVPESANAAATAPAPEVSQ